MKYLSNYNKYSEQRIIDDILNTNEGIGDIISKIKEYGKKGLLTTAILLSLAGSANAANNRDEVIKVGLENIDNKDKVEFYNAVIGLSTRYESESMNKSDIDAAGAFKEISIYYTNLRDNKPTEELSDPAKKYLQVIFNSISKYDDSQRAELIKYGASVKRI